MEWSSLKRARRCLRCGSGFEDGDGYHSFLRCEEGVMEREDYCDRCAQISGRPRGERIISRWQGRYRPEPVRKKEEPIAGGTAEQLLKKYMHSDDPAHVNVRYILALMLERRKKLVARDTVIGPGDSKKRIVYEMPSGGETFLIEDPGLRLSQARAVQMQVRKLLEEEGKSG